MSASPAPSTASLIAGIDPAWLAKTQEEILEPDLPICDPHHHLWDRPDHTYLLGDFLTDAGSGHTIESTVFAECGAFYRTDGPDELHSIGEIEFVRGVHAMTASGRYGAIRVGASMVGYADLTLGDRVESVLATAVAAGGGRFVGIRHSAAWDAGFSFASSHGAPRAQLYLDPTFRQGFRHLAAHGLSFDAWVYHRQLGDVLDLARAFPEQPIILNHVGGPAGIGPYAGKLAEEFPVWQRGMRALAGCANVTVKLGGFGSKRAGFGWHERPQPPTSQEVADAWRPYVETCVETFGATRCMFESNFPVDKVSMSYAVLWNACKRLAAGASATEKAALFGGTAKRVYRVA
jgi:L-fuconolactonase